MHVIEDMGVASGFETLSTLTSSKGFTSSLIAPTTGNFSGKHAIRAIISVETADVRFTIDGTTPTVTSGTGAGHLLVSGASYEIRGRKNVANFRCINAVGSSGAVLKCTYCF